MHETAESRTLKANHRAGRLFHKSRRTYTYKPTATGNAVDTLSEREKALVTMGFNEALMATAQHSTETQINTIDHS